MKNGKRLVIFICLFLALLPCLSSGQSLMDNEDYRNARLYQQKAEDSFRAGDYDKAYEYSELARQYTAKARVFAEGLRLRYRAVNYSQLASNRLTWARSVGAEWNYPNEYAMAVKDLQEAKRTLEDGRYEASISFSKNVLRLLSDVQIPKGK